MLNNFHPATLNAVSAGIDLPADFDGTPEAVRVYAQDEVGGAVTRVIVLFNCGDWSGLVQRVGSAHVDFDDESNSWFEQAKAAAAARRAARS